MGMDVAGNYYRVENKQTDADDVMFGAASAEAVGAHRRRIEPWLSAIFQSEHLNLLLGSGFSTALAKAGGVTPLTMGRVAIDPGLDGQINKAADESARQMGRGTANIEDQLRCAIALNEGLSILGDPRQAAFEKSLKGVLTSYAASVVGMEAELDSLDLVDDARAEKFEGLLKGFLLSFSGRTASRDRLHVFTTNYDRLIEHGFDLLGIRPLDRFVGALSPRFRASRFDVDIHYTPQGGRGEARPLEGVVRFTKLHGSVDWRSRNGHISRTALPFGGKYAAKADDAFETMIYPNASKDVETAYFPYAELFRDFSAALCRPNSALVTYGYGFGDDHVNRVIRDMLTLPSSHLLIISYDDAGGRIPKFVQASGKAAQISLVVGPQLAGLEQLVGNYLPKPAIDTITERQAVLLGKRGQSPDSGQDR
jgi:hypothetical protein